MSGTLIWPSRLIVITGRHVPHWSRKLFFKSLRGIARMSYEIPSHANPIFSGEYVGVNRDAHLILVKANDIVSMNRVISKKRFSSTKKR